MTEMLGRFAYRRRWLVLAAAVAFLAVAVAWGTGVFGRLTSGGFEDPGSQSARAAAVAAADLGRDDADVVVLYRSADRTVDDPAYRQAVTGTLAALPADAVARAVSWFGTGAPGLVSADRHATYAVLTLRGDEQQRSDALERIEDRLAAPGLTTEVGGATTVGRDINERVSKDIARAETLSMPVLLVLLVLVFGTVVAATLPLVIGVVAILGAFTALRLLSLVTEVSVFSVNVVTILGLGLAIDYGLFVVGRLPGGAGPRAATPRRRSSGRWPPPAARSPSPGVTVAAALAGLLIFPQVFLRSMGVGGIAAVLVAVAAALTVLPALLAVLGPRVDALPVRRRRSPRRADTGAWARLARSVMRRPVRYAVGVVAVLLAARPAVPAGHVRRDRRPGAAGRHREPAGRRDAGAGLPGQRDQPDPGRGHAAGRRRPDRAAGLGRRGQDRARHHLGDRGRRARRHGRGRPSASPATRCRPGPATSSSGSARCRRRPAGPYSSAATPRCCPTCSAASAGCCRRWR